MAMSYDPGRKKLLIFGCGALLCIVLAVILWSSQRPDVTSGSEQDRIDAVTQIAAERLAGARRSLARAVKDESPRVRRAAIISLAQMVQPEDRNAIEEAISDNDPTVRAVAAECLGRFNDAKAAAKLSAVAESAQEDKSVRKAALRGLVPCDAPIAVVTLIEIAGDESIPNEVRLQAGKSMLAKAGGKLNPDRRPENRALWRDLVQRLKNDKRTRDKYSAAGVKLVNHPDHIVTD